MEEFVFASELKVNVKRRGKTMMMSMKHAARVAFLALIVVSACVARAAWVPEQDARMVDVLEGDGATMRFRVTPGDGTASSAFLRIKK